MGVGVLVVCDVADSHRALLLDVGQERPLVVGHESEDTVVVGNRESDTVDTFFLGRGTLLRLELQTVERREHAELELQLILFRDLEVPPAVPDPLGERDGVGLYCIASVSLVVVTASEVKDLRRSG